MGKKEAGKENPDSETESPLAIALSEKEEERLFADYSKKPSEENAQRIIDQFKNLVYHIVHRYFSGRDSFDDLVQVGMLGLLYAIKRFEAERGLRFSTYAFQTIRGEIQRYLRDKSWSMTVPRVLKERSLKVLTAQNCLALKLGTAPTVEQISEETSLSAEEVQEALEIGSAYHPLQIMEEITPSETEITDTSPEGQTDIRSLQEDMLWNQLLSYVSETEALILRLRFWEGLSQREVAERLGTSQMNVSRIQRQALAKLRSVINPDDLV